MDFSVIELNWLKRILQRTIHFSVGQVMGDAGRIAEKMCAKFLLCGVSVIDEPYIHH